MEDNSLKTDNVVYDNQGIKNEPKVDSQQSYKPEGEFQLPRRRFNIGRIFIGILLIVIVVSLLVASYILFFRKWRNNGQSSVSTELVTYPTPEPTADPTSEWEIYRDMNRKFSIRYPTGWTVGAGNDKNDLLPIAEISLFPPDKMVAINILIVGGNWNSFVNSDEVTLSEPTNINGIPAFLNLQDAGGVNEEEYTLKTNSESYLVKIYKSVNEKAKDDDVVTLNYVLGSFSFF